MKSLATTALDLMFAFMSWRGNSPARKYRSYTTDNKAREMARRVRQRAKYEARRTLREVYTATWHHIRDEMDQEAAE